MNRRALAKNSRLEQELEDAKLGSSAEAAGERSSSVKAVSQNSLQASCQVNKFEDRWIC